MGLWQRERITVVQETQTYVCRNGHVRTDQYDPNAAPPSGRCLICGEALLGHCPHCNARIPGKPKAAGVSLAAWLLPDHCPQCGVAYPWSAQAAHTGNAGSAVARIEQICKRFQLVARRLQKRYANRGTLVIGDEYDVQDLLATVLAADFDDVRDEEFTSSVAGQNSRIDFVLVGPGIAVETKMTRENLTDRKLADELLVDIRRYEAHPSARHLVCFVYDPDLRVKNPAGLVRDLENSATRFETLKVIIAPRGT